MLRNMHRGSIHTGKVPARLVETRRRNQELARLRGDLEKAVMEERFEEAASLRDAIRRVEEAPRETSDTDDSAKAPVNRVKEVPLPLALDQPPPETKPRRKS